MTSVLHLPDGWQAWNPAEKAKLLDTLRQAKATRLPKDPVGWGASQGVELWSMQRTILASVQASKRTVVQSGAGIGKSFTAAYTVCWWVCTHQPGDVYVWTTAPGGDQVSGILWEEIRKLHDALDLPGRVGLDNKWRIGGKLVASGRKPADSPARSDDDPDTGQGFHRRYLLVVLDDAGGLAEWLWDAAENITTGDDCRILADGNPDHAGSRFAQVCDHHPLWQQFEVSVLDSPNFTGEPVSPELAAALTTREWLADRAVDWGNLPADMKQALISDPRLVLSMGITDRRFISKVLAKFPSDHPDQVIPARDAAACRLGEPRAASELLPVELGVDVGGGKDRTVIRERRGIRGGRRWAKLTDRPEVAGRLLVQVINETGATSVKIDATGIGWGLAGEVRNAQARGDIGRHVRVHAVMVGEKSREPRKYANIRAELWYGVGRGLSQDRGWDLSAMDEADSTIAELMLPRWFPDARGRVQVEPKDDIRVRTGGRSPDDADALLLAYYTPKDAQSAWFEAAASGKLGR